MTVIHFLQHVDQTVTLFINSFHTPFTDAMWQFFSAKEIWFPFYLLVAVCLVRRLGWKRGAAAVVACILTIVCCDQLANFTKETVGRLRPCWDLNMVDGGLHLLEGRGNLYGFYSAHAANAMGFAVCTGRCFKAGRHSKRSAYYAIAVIWALLVGASRIFVGKHFFGDVCVGFLVGYLFGKFFSFLACRLNL